MSDVAYYRRRADDERARAKASANPKVGAIHEKLAQNYEELIALIERDAA